MNNIKILGSGKSTPKNKIDNHFFENTVEKNDEWIFKKTGIKTRYIIENEEEYTDLIIASAKESILNSNIDKQEINLVIIATSTPTNLFGCSSKIVDRLNINNALSFDITLACNGFNTAFYSASQYLKNDKFKYALVIGCDCLSRWVDWSDYKTSILFGDGAGSIVIGKNTENYGIIDYFYSQNNSKNNILSINVNEKISYVNNECVKNNTYKLMHMNGREVFNYVVNELPNFILNSLNSCQLSLDNIKYIIPHQANKQILNILADKLDISKNKILSNIEHYGNTSAASIPILLHETIEKNLLEKDDIIMFLGFGAGMSSSIIIFKYN